MPDSKLICRLCMRNLHGVHENCVKKLKGKIKFCMGVEILDEDGMSTTICKQCKKKVKKFYNFKQRCLEVELILKSKLNQLPVEVDTNELNIDSPLKYDFEYYPSENSMEVNTDNYKETLIDEEIRINADAQQLEYFNNYSHNHEVKNIQNVQISNENEFNQMQCELCGCIVDTKSFKKHLATHADKTKKFQCKLCLKQFTRAENKMIHMRSHMGIRPYICEMCGQSSTKRQDLIRHLKIHSDERNHECPDCGRCFKRSGDLYTHLRTHTGIRPFKCRLCDKDYTSHSGLRKHYKTHYEMES